MALLRLSLAAVLLGLAAPALAQSHAERAVEAGDAVWIPRVTAQAVDALGSPATRADALHDLGTLIATSPAGVDLRPAVPALLDVLASDPDPRVRLMAVSVLSSTPDREILDALRDGVLQQTDSGVQHAMLYTVVAHGGPGALADHPAVLALALALQSGQSVSGPLAAR